MKRSPIAAIFLLALPASGVASPYYDTPATPEAVISVLEGMQNGSIRLVTEDDDYELKLMRRNSETFYDANPVYGYSQQSAHGVLEFIAGYSKSYRTVAKAQPLFPKMQRYSLFSSDVLIYPGFWD